MKSHSLDNLYTQLDRQIRLVESHTELTNLAYIIKACRLKPYTYFFEKKSSNLVMYYRWFDEFGNSLSIDKKKIRIQYNDLSLSRDAIVSTDLYYGLSLNKIAKMSKMAYLISGKDEDKYQDCHVLSFLGLDNYLRTYTYLYGEWSQISPLVLWLPHLQIIAENADITYFRELDNKENSPLPCISQSTWLISLPTSVSFLSLIGKSYDNLLPIFENK